LGLLVLIPKALIAVVFIGAVIQKLNGKAAPNWERWGFSRRAMYATGAAEVLGLLLFWWPGLEPIGAAVLALLMLGALATLVKNREAAAHVALPALTLILVLIQLYQSLVA